MSISYKPPYSLPFYITYVTYRALSVTPIIVALLVRVNKIHWLLYISVVTVTAIPGASQYDASLHDTHVLLAILIHC